MKIPLFIYDYEARQYRLFPHPEMFTTLSDGSIGFRFGMWGVDHTDHYKKAFLKYRYLFEPNPLGWPDRFSGDHEYRLRRQS